MSWGWKVWLTDLEMKHIAHARGQIHDLTNARATHAAWSVRKRLYHATIAWA